MGKFESLAGRIAYSELTPFSLREVKNVVMMEDHWIRRISRTSADG
ncbi:MAG: hypothetical protein R3C61_24260 [Bacteroidia bacterium]